MASPATEHTPAASSPQVEEPDKSTLVADSLVDPAFGAIAFIRMLEKEGSDAEEDDPSEEVVTQTFLGKTSSTDVLTFRATVARDWKQTDCDSFQLMVKLPSGRLVEAPLHDLVGKNFSRNVELFIELEENENDCQHFKSGRMQVKDPSKSTAGKNHDRQLTHEQQSIMHACGNDLCRTDPQTGIFYGLKHPNCDLVAISRVISKCKKDATFKSRKMVDRDIKRAVGKYLNQSKNTPGANKLRAAREQERLRREAGPPAAATAPAPAPAVSPAPAPVGEGVATGAPPAGRKRQPTKKAKELLMAAKSGATLTPAAKRKQAKAAAAKETASDE